MERRALYQVKTLESEVLPLSPPEGKSQRDDQQKRRRSSTGSGAAPSGPGIQVVVINPIGSHKGVENEALVRQILDDGVRAVPQIFMSEDCPVNRFARIPVEPGDLPTAFLVVAVHQRHRGRLAVRRDHAVRRNVGTSPD